MLGVPAAHLVGRRSWRRGQTASGGSIPRWSTGKPQVVTRRKATGAGKKNMQLRSMFDAMIGIESSRPNASLLRLEGRPQRKCPCDTPPSANGCQGYGLHLWMKVSNMATITKLLHWRPFSSLLSLCL